MTKQCMLLLLVAVVGCSAYTWEELTSITNQPSARRGMASASYDNKLYVHGGKERQAATNYWRSDMWSADLDNTAAWTDYKTPYGPPPGDRSGHTMVASDDGVLVMFGGVDSEGTYYDTVHWGHVGGCRSAPPSSTLDGAAEGTSWCFSVNAIRSLEVYGDNPAYRSGSDLHAAAVHAGVLEPGQVGQIRVTKVEGQAWYNGTTRNGVIGRPAHGSSAAYHIQSLGPCPSAPLKTDGATSADTGYSWYSGSFLVTTTGTKTIPGGEAVTGGDSITDTWYPYDNGYYWGYKSDSYIPSAVVHAGVIADTAFGAFRLTIRPDASGFTNDNDGRRSVTTTADNPCTDCSTFSVGPVADEVCPTVTIASGAAPTARANHVAVSYGGYMYVYGGLDADGTTVLDDFYRLKISGEGAWAWTKISAATGIGARQSAAAVIDVRGAHARLWVHGGIDGGATDLDDLKYYTINDPSDDSQNAWTAVANPSTVAMSRHKLFVAMNHLYAYGTSAKKLYFFDIPSGVWNTPTVSGLPESNQAFDVAFGASYAAGKPLECPTTTAFFIFGGEKSAGALSSSLSKLTLPEMTFKFANLSVGLQRVYAGEMSTIQYDVNVGPCGNGLRSGGKIQFDLDPAFVIDRMTLGTDYRLDISAPGSPYMYSVPSDNFALNADNKVIVDTGSNLLVNGGGERALSTEWVKDNDVGDGTDVAWSRVNDQPDTDRAGMAPKFGYYHLAADVNTGAAATDVTRLYQDVSLADVPAGSTLYLRGYAAWATGDTASVELYWYDGMTGTACSGTASADVGPGTITGTDATWELFEQSYTLPGTAVCARVKLVSEGPNDNNDGFFDDVFFGTYDIPTFNLGITFQANLTGLKVPAQCSGSDNWAFGVRTYKYDETDGTANDWEAGIKLEQDDLCLDRCHACKFEEELNGVKTYTCTWPGADGELSSYTRDDLPDDNSPAAAATTCGACSGNPALCSGVANA